MKRILYLLLLSAPLISACHNKIWDRLNDHEARIARLETLCNQFNTNIMSLQSIVEVIQARDYVKDVVPITENGTVIGYAITFAYGTNPVTIYNGKNGQDGHTPLIGIRNVDGGWFWTLDGDWILDKDGNRIRANGTEGTTPRLKIEDDYWWVSYDNGASWDQAGPAVSSSGSGDSMFKEIRQDENFVYLVLSNGETIQLAKSHGLTWVYV